ncbi:MAG TPA: hypothetical protein VGD81_02640, partial [Opitutaceae bacterium]
PAAPARAAAKPAVVRGAGAVAIEAGGSRYVFDPATGRIASIDWAGVRVVTGSDLAVWRPPTDSECRPFAARKVQQPWDTFLQGMPATARDFAVAETPDGIRISTTTDYRGDGGNSVQVDYVYHVDGDGRMRVQFKVRPNLPDVDALPEIGLEFAVGDAVREFSWLGLGPGDSLPNRRASALFGQWRLPVADRDLARPRSGVERLDLGLSGEGSVRVDGLVGFRVVPGSSGGRRLRLFSHQAGAWVKGGPPERPQWRLDLAEGRVFEGAFEFSPPVRP